MEFTVNITKFAPYFDGAPLISVYSFDNLPAALQSASQWACLSLSDSIEVVDAQGHVYSQWTSLYNFMYRFKDEETPNECYNRNLSLVIQQVEKHFISELSPYLQGRDVSFIDNDKIVTFTIVPGTESILLDACMDAGCMAEVSEEEGILDFPVMKTAMNKYRGELERSQQRYEKHRQRQLDAALLSSYRSNE